MQSSYFSGRRSVRQFASRDVDTALLNSVIERALRAPTTGNMQLYSVIVSREPEKRSRLAALHFNQPAAAGAPVILTVCADFNRFTRWCKLNNADAGFDNFLSFTNAYADAMIFAQQIVTIAEMEGLGTCYLGTVTYNAKEIASLLRLPSLTVPVAAIAIGWPQGEGVATERLAVETIMHDEEYREDSDAAVMEAFKVKEDFPANSGFVKENGKQNLAQVFSEVRYPRSMNEEFSGKFLSFLKESGFLK